MLIELSRTSEIVKVPSLDTDPASKLLLDQRSVSILIVEGVKLHVPELISD